MDYKLGSTKKELAKHLASGTAIVALGGAAVAGFAVAEKTAHEKPDFYHTHGIAQEITDGRNPQPHSALTETTGSAIETARQLAGDSESINKLASEIQAQAADDKGNIQAGTPVVLDTDYLDAGKVSVAMQPQPNGQEYPTIVVNQQQ